MSRSLDDLSPAFEPQVATVLEACAQRGVTMRAFYTRRSPWNQGRIWRSTRSTQEVIQASERLKANRAPFLARILLEVGPQFSAPGARGHLTNALPGVSWHQWDEAIDCFWLLHGKAEWSIKKESDISGGLKGNGYQVYADEALEAGLFSAGLGWGWDWPHIQLRNTNSPLNEYSWEQIDKKMLDAFGETEPS